MVFLNNLFHRYRSRMEQTIHIKNVNDIYPIIGDGIYQVLIIGMICLAMLPTSMQNFQMLFLSISPEWVFSGTSNSSSSLDVICSLNSSRWEWKTPIDKTIISKVNIWWFRSVLCQNCKYLLSCLID